MSPYEEELLGESISAQGETLLCTQASLDYEEADQTFLSLLQTEDLDQHLHALHPLVSAVEDAVSTALLIAFQEEGHPESDQAHLFLQRLLYRINRMKLFWYDDLKAYENERSPYILSIRNQIESAWQNWELKSFDLETLQKLDVQEVLQDETLQDLSPKTSEADIFFRDQVGQAGYRRLLEIASLDGLVEASQLSRMLGGANNEIHSVLTRLLLEEYGNGKLSRKHSSYFKMMMTVLDMNTKPEAYFDCVPWQVLAGINHSFLLSERKRHFLRYIGGLLHTEISIPGGFRHYLAAATRLGFSNAAMGYWSLHIKEDERHGRWMLRDVALPLIRRYPVNAWELVLGYHQQRHFSRRASASVLAAAREAEEIDSERLEL